MRKSTIVKLSKEAFNALESELVRRVKATGNYRLTLKDLASEIILAALPSVSKNEDLGPFPPVDFPPSEKKTMEVMSNA